ncbi:MAG: NIPSNAP family protein [Mesorhizobium sp.]|nr:NIPSNAP family protein [Mesorhizobium sp.]
MTVLELRQYTMVPGRRGDFVEIFDREFVETQEALGIEVVGQFVDLDRPDRYVWMRRFPDMESRKASLEAFYGGPVWAAHKDAANATMTEWHDVLPLRPAWEGSDVVDKADRAAAGAAASGGEMTVAIWPVAGERLAEFAAVFRSAYPAARAAYVTEPADNTYPALPVRAGESVFVGVFDGLSVIHDLGAAGVAPAQILRLAPTARSRLRGA